MPESLKQLEKAQAQLKEIDKKIEDNLPYHIEQIEMQLARMKGIFDTKHPEPKKKIDLLGNHGEITWHLDKIKEMLEEFEETVKDVQRKEETFEEESKKASVIAQVMNKRSSQI
jgi:hypothetical protein